MISNHEAKNAYVVRCTVLGKFEAAFAGHESAVAYARKLASDFGRPYIVFSPNGRTLTVKP